MPKPINTYSSLFLTLFLLFSLANLLALATPAPLDNYLTKPLLMIWLGLYVVSEQASFPPESRKWLLTGLFFAFLGDTFLLFADGRPSGGTFFLLGLGSFLLTHVAYWMAFHRYPERKRAGSSYWLKILPLLAYWAILSYVLLPALPAAMTGPVIVYSIVIIAMAAKAVSILPALPPGNARMLLSGVVLFVLSDTIIALSRFTDLWPFSGLLAGLAIMLTYLAGQLLIVLGMKANSA